jgi:hemolysin D
VIASDLAQLNAQVASLNAQANQKRAERDRLVSTITSQKQLIATIQASSVTTVGQVLTSGEEIMRIVPEDAALEIECYLPN